MGLLHIKAKQTREAAFISGAHLVDFLKKLGFWADCVKSIAFIYSYIGITAAFGEFGMIHRASMAVFIGKTLQVNNRADEFSSDSAPCL